MNLLAGLEKFGLSTNGELDITKDGSEAEKKPSADQKETEKVLKEADFLIEKVIQCTVCDRKFKTLTVKTGKAKRLEPDDDLRPRFQGVDTIKYDVAACPFCGYSASHKDFEHLSSTQIKWIKEGVSANFKPTKDESFEEYSYDQAVDRYKLALVCTMTKKGKMSEKSYLCLKIAWLRRTQYELIKDDSPEDLEKKKAVKTEWDGFYRQAYEGFVKASETETPPYAGIDANTLDFMLANMAMFFKDYSTASKLVSRLLTSSGTSSRIKDKCFDMKEIIVAEVKRQKAESAKKV